jgi:hypothetical protein
LGTRSKSRDSSNEQSERKKLEHKPQIKSTLS